MITQLRGIKLIKKRNIGNKNKVSGAKKKNNKKEEKENRLQIEAK